MKLPVSFSLMSSLDTSNHLYDIAEQLSTGSGGGLQMLAEACPGQVAPVPFSDSTLTAWGASLVGELLPLKQDLPLCLSVIEVRCADAGLFGDEAPTTAATKALGLQLSGCIACSCKRSVHECECLRNLALLP